MTRRGRRGLGIALIGLLISVAGVLIAVTPAIADSVTGAAIANLIILAGIIVGGVGLAMVAWTLIRS